jgi:hypothetical protein
MEGSPQIYFVGRVLPYWMRDSAEQDCLNEWIILTISYLFFIGVLIAFLGAR